MISDEPIPLFSAAAANAGIDFMSALKRVIDRHWYILGEEVKSFETQFARYVGIEHCITVANGTDALELALRALGVGRGDRVATVANAGFYGSTAIHAIGGKAVYVDIDESSLTMAASALAKVLKNKPKAVIVTHLYGQLADIDELVRLANEAGVPLVEDCAQSHGALRNSKQAGSYGDVGCFSFYPTKNLGALGDGGAVVTRNTALADKIRMLRQYGWSQKYQISLPGGRNSRLDEMQAAILSSKLPLLDGLNGQRRSIAKRYSAAFSQFPVRSPVSIGDDYVAHLYVLRVSKRHEFAAFLRTRGVMTDIHYPVPDYRQPAYPRDVPCDIEVTERACESVISLPCYPGLTDQQVDRVISAVQEYFSNRASL